MGSLLKTIHWKKLLWWMCNDLWVQQYVIWNHSIILFILQNDCSRFSLRAHDLSSLRFSASLTLSNIGSISWRESYKWNVFGYSHNLWYNGTIGHIFSKQVITLAWRVQSWVRLMITFHFQYHIEHLPELRMLASMGKASAQL